MLFFSAVFLFPAWNTKSCKITVNLLKVPHCTRSSLLNYCKVLRRLREVKLTGWAPVDLKTGRSILFCRIQNSTKNIIFLLDVTVGLSKCLFLWCKFRPWLYANVMRLQQMRTTAVSNVLVSPKKRILGTRCFTFVKSPHFTWQPWLPCEIWRGARPDALPQNFDPVASDPSRHSGQREHGLPSLQERKNGLQGDKKVNRQRRRPGRDGEDKEQQREGGEESGEDAQRDGSRDSDVNEIKIKVEQKRGRVWSEVIRDKLWQRIK